MVQMLMAAGAGPLIVDRRGRTPLDIALTIPGKEVLTAMMAGGLLKKVKAEALLSYGVQARRFGLALAVVLMRRKGWHPLLGMGGMANPVQARFLADQTPWRALSLLRETSDPWAVLDAL